VCENKKNLLRFINELTEEEKENLENQVAAISFSNLRQIYLNSYKDDDIKKEKLNSNDNILVIVDREENYYLVNRLEHKL